MVFSPIRELPVGARQLEVFLYIPSELCTEQSRLHRVRPLLRFECRRKPEREWYRRGYNAFVS